ncbi:MAG: leucine-rich repeat domain-containing protein [Candidatus Poribacteria bacterium]|nr:leucine-rich repeat domain-containing protein [Candidatus Poribacteria bacterium]
MKKFLFTISVCCILFPTLLHKTNAGPNDAVSIPDTELRAIIEGLLGKDSGDTITEGEMSGIGDMNNEIIARTPAGTSGFGNTKITDLTGLEYATNLKIITLFYEHITDLSPLADLTNLEELRLPGDTFLIKHGDIDDQGPSITDISALTKLTKLKQLDLSEQSITDLEPLRELTALTNLDLGASTETGNRSLSNLEPLKGLTALTILNLSYNQITDVSHLSGLTALTRLWLPVNLGLQDISPLRTLTNLQLLHLNGTNITHETLSETLPALSNLNDLNLLGTPISDLSVLDRLPTDATLTKLDLRFLTHSGRTGAQRGRLLTDITPLIGLQQAGKVTSIIDLNWNWNLDYDSLYTEIPALIAAGINTRYSSFTFAFEGESAKNHVGRPGTRHTFVARASTTFQYGENPNFKGVPVTWTVTAPDGTKTASEAVTGNDGLTRVSIILGNAGQTHTVDAVVPAKTTSVTDLQHDELSVRFTATADNKAPIAPDPTLSGLTVTFEDYPEDQPIDEFGITIKFSEPITEFQMEDIIIETKLATGTGAAALKELAPAIQPTQIYPARIGLPADATGTVRLIVRAGAALTPLGQIGPVTNTASEFIAFGHAYDEDIRYRPPPALVVIKIDFAKGMFWIQNTTQYRFSVEMRIYSEDHRDKWFKVSERALIPIEDAETLAFSLTPPETDDASIKHLNSELLLSQNQNQPLKLSSQKFCIKLIRAITVDTASNMNEDFRVKDTRWAPPGDVIFRQYDKAWDVKLKGLRRDHLAYYRFPLDGKLADSWNVEESVPAAPSKSSRQLRVVLSQFRSEHTESGVIVEWTTASELENAGFYVLRSRERSSDFVRVSPSLIVGAGTTTEQNTYTYQDTTAEANVPYYYRLEEVSLSGDRRALATVRLRGHVSAANKVLWKWADVKSQD